MRQLEVMRLPEAIRLPEAMRLVEATILLEIVVGHSHDFRYSRKNAWNGENIKKLWEYLKIYYYFGLLDFINPRFSKSIGKYEQFENTE